MRMGLERQAATLVWSQKKKLITHHSLARSRTAQFITAAGPAQRVAIRSAKPRANVAVDTDRGVIGLILRN